VKLGRFLVETRMKLFENRVLRGICGSNRDDVKRNCRKLHNEELNDLYPSPSTFRVIKSRTMCWARHKARMGRVQVYIGFGWGDLRERDHLEDQSICEILLIINGLDRQVAGTCECGDEISG